MVAGGPWSEAMADTRSLKAVSSKASQDMMVVKECEEATGLEGS